MSVQGPDYLQLLGGVLVVLSLFLLWCWYSKQNNNKSLPAAMLDALTQSESESFASQKVSRNYLGGLHFKENMQVGSMHDLENVDVGRNSRVNSKMQKNLTGLRWQIDGMTGIDDNEYDENSYVDRARKTVTMHGDVITPAPHGSVTDTNCRSLSGAVMRLTDNNLIYGDARNTSVST